MVQIEEVNMGVLKIDQRIQDNKEQISALALFASLVMGVWLILSVISIKEGSLVLKDIFLSPLFIFFVLSLGFILYFVGSLSTAIIDLPHNQWSIVHRIFFIPYSFKKGRIVDLSRIEVVQIKNKKATHLKDLYPNRIQYLVGLQFVGFKDDKGHVPRYTFLKKKTFSSLGYVQTVKKYVEVGKEIEKFLKKYGIPIEFEVEFIVFDEKTGKMEKK